MAALPDAVLFKGTVAPEIKAAMGLRIAQVNGSPYVAAHMLRVLKGHDRGGVLRSAMEGSAGSRLSTSEQVALRYAEILTRTVNARAERLRARRRDVQRQRDRRADDDRQLLQLLHALRRGAEPAGRALGARRRDDVAGAGRPAGRASRASRLLADDEITAAAAALAQSKDPAVQQARNSLGLGMANSQRAMLRVPGIQQAWRAFGSSFREKATIGRDIQLQVSFAVSTANECRYCTLHQVQGLRRLGVDPIKLQAMRKDDSALTPRELAAVKFARKLTDRPSGIDRRGLRRGEEGVRRRRRPRGAASRPATSPS